MPAVTGSYCGVAFADLDDHGFLDVVASRAGGGGIGVWRFWNVGWHDFSSELPESGTRCEVALGDLDILAGSDALRARAWTSEGAASGQRA